VGYASGLPAGFQPAFAKGGAMITKADFTAVGTPGAKRLIVIFGIFLTACWSVTTLVGQWQAELRCYALGFHECAGAPVVLRLLVYSLLHKLVTHWLLDLVVLWGILVTALRHFSPAAFARLYSLGSITCGAVFLLAASQWHNTTPLFGGGGGLMALIGAFLVRWPERLHRVRKWVVFALALFFAALGVLGGQEYDTNVGELPVSAYLCSLLGAAAALGAGILHGVLERLHKARTS
jgi:membrane associated rhomboid family serine protease